MKDINLFLNLEDIHLLLVLSTFRLLDTGECRQILEGYTNEIFSCSFNYDRDIIITASKDNTCMIWKLIN